MFRGLAPPRTRWADKLLPIRVPRGPEASTALKSCVALGMLSPLLYSEPLRVHVAAPDTPALRVGALGGA